MNYLKKELYKEIQTNESIFDFIQEAGLDGFWYWDLENPQNQWMNQKYWICFGYYSKEEQNQVTKWQNLIFKEDLVHFLNHLDICLKDSNYPFNMILRYKHKSEKTIWIRCRGIIIKNSIGKPIRFLGAHIDITDSKELELAEIEKANFFRNIEENDYLFILKIDKNRNYSYVNDYYCKFHKLNKKDILGNSTTLGMIEEDIPKAIQVGEFCFQNPNKKRKLEIRKKINDKIVIGQWEFIGLPDETGQTKELLCLGYDITSIKTNELKLLEREAELLSILENTDDAICLKDKNHKIIYYNNPFKKIIKKIFNIEISINMSTFDYLNEVQKKSWEKNIKQVLEGKKITFEFDWFEKYGIINYYELSHNPIFSKNEVIGYSEFVRDITDSIKSKALIESTYNLLNTLISFNIVLWKIDLKTFQFSLDSNWTKQYKLNSLNNQLYSLFKKLHLDDKKRCIEVFKKFLLNQDQLIQLEFRLKNDENEWFWVSIRGGLLEENSNKSLYGIAQDITFNKIYEESLLKQNDELSKSNQMKTEFLSNISHEIRTPLNGVLGYTDLLLRTELSILQMKYLQDLRYSAEALSNIVNDVLDLTKIEAGKLELEKVKVDLLEVLKEILAIGKSLSLKKSIELILDYSIQIPKIVILDPIRFKQILLNLVSNAIKFTSEGEIVLKVKFKEINPNLGRYRFTVSDTGIGIKEENKSKLFKVFSQIDSSITRKYGGTGIGLVIAENLAQKMQSHIQFESVYGKGSSFYFDIDLEFETEKNIDSLSFQKLAILEKNKTSLEIFSSFLTEINIPKIYKFLDFSKLIESLEENISFDIILYTIDDNFTESFENLKVIQKLIKARNFSTQIITIHSVLNEKIIELLKNHKIQDCILKPIFPLDVYTILSNIKNLQKKDFIESSPVKKLYHSTKKYQILIVEDLEINRTILKSILNKMIPNADIKEAENGEIGIQCFKELEFDLIFMDIQMPILDGLETATKIRELEKDKSKKSTILAFTVSALLSQKEACLKAGMDDYFTKPIRIETMSKILEKYLI